jgi:hypothetical protein
MSPCTSKNRKYIATSFFCVRMNKYVRFAPEPSFWCKNGVLTLDQHKTIANKGVLKYMKLGIVRYPNFSYVNIAPYSSIILIFQNFSDI